MVGHGVTDSMQADAALETGDNVNSPPGGVASGVDVAEGRVREAGFEADEGEGEEEEEEEEVVDEEEEVDEDELDLEYSYDDEDEEDMADYLHVDVPWGLREYHVQEHACAGTCMVQGHACAETCAKTCMSRS